MTFVFGGGIDKSRLSRGRARVGQSAFWITTQLDFKFRVLLSFIQEVIDVIFSTRVMICNCFLGAGTSAVHIDCSIRAWCWHYQFRKLASPNPRLTTHTSNLKTTFMTNKESQLVLGKDIENTQSLTIELTYWLRGMQASLSIPACRYRERDILQKSLIVLYPE